MADEELYADIPEGYEEEMPNYEAGEDFGDGVGANATAEELEAMKRKLKEMEEEAAKLKAMQAGDGGAAATVGTGSVDPKEEADARSIYVGNVDYGATPEELQLHFQSCGTVNRVTILTDKFGNPKGYAYIEFLEVDAVANAVLLNDSELRGRQIKVNPKRTNMPGFKFRGRGRGRGHYPPSFYGGRGYYQPRGRGFYAGPPRGRGRGRHYAPY